MGIFKTGLGFVLLCAFGAVGQVIAQKAVIPPEMKLAALPVLDSDLINREKTELGRLLFFDPILSATQKVACSTCHHPEYGWADGRATPLGVGAQGLGPKRIPTEMTGIPPLSRNTLGLVNVAFNGLVNGVKYDPSAAPMFWGSQEKGLEAQVFHPIRTPAEMLGTTMPESRALVEMVKRVSKVAGYREKFAEIFPAQNGGTITASRIASVIADFERTLVAGNTPFDRFMRGDKSAMTVQQQRGMKTFEKAGCMHCHGGPMFSDFKLHFIGVLGTGRDDQQPMRTPTLRNLRFTAPYLHHGRMRSLEKAMIFYEQLMDRVSETLDGGDAVADAPLDPLLKHLHLEVEDFPDVLAFLNALNDESYDVSVPKAVPSGLKVSGE